MRTINALAGLVLLTCGCTACVAAAPNDGGPKEIAVYRQSLDWQKLQSDVSKRSSLVVQIKHLHAVNLPATAVFLAIADKLGLAVGVESLANQGAVPTVSLDVSDQSAFDVLNALDAACGSKFGVDWAGAGYVNYVPAGYATPNLPDKEHKFTPKEPAASVFSPVVTEFFIFAKSPPDAVRRLMNLDCVRNQPPALPVSVRGGEAFIELVRTSSRGLVGIPMSNPPVHTVRVRGALNMIALAAGKNWIADTYTNERGVRQVRIRFFDRASEVCPDVAKVTVEVDESKSAAPTE